MKNKTIFDTIGIGFGPGNIALAVSYAESNNQSSTLFLESKPTPNWQEGMLIWGSDIQHNPLRDFITPRNPCSPYGFLTYLKEHDRLFHFLNLDVPFPPRSDYAKYIRWVAEKFNNKVLYGKKVVSITFLLSEEIPLLEVKTEDKETFYAKSISFAPGRSKNIPDIFQPYLSDRIVHFTDYSTSVKKWKETERVRSIVIVGASQSAVEILLDLDAQLPNAKLYSIFRNFSYVLKDVSPFTEDLLFPRAVDYFYNASEQSKKALTNQVKRSNYSSADHDIISKFYYLLYEKRVNGKQNITLLNNRVISEVLKLDERTQLTLEEIHTKSSLTLQVDAVILATGFRNSGNNQDQELIHPLLHNIARFYKKNADGTLHVNRFYKLVPKDEYPELPPVFLNGLCESSHGLGDAGSFSLLSYRAHDIEKAIKEELAENKCKEHQF